MGTQFTIEGRRIDWSESDSGQLELAMETLLVDVHNANAKAIFRLLGMPTDEQPCGSMAAPVLRLLVQGALMAGADSEYRPPSTHRGWPERGMGRCRVIDGGVNPDRLEARLRQLLKLCDTAGRTGVIRWS